MPSLVVQAGDTAFVAVEENQHGMPLHQPAMLPQVLKLLDPSPGEVALDLTVGTGGHSLAIAPLLGPDGLILGIDLDRQALLTADERLKETAPCPVRLFPEPFSRAPEVLQEAGAAGADVVLADLGVGTHQLLRPERGFSFESEQRLDMRYDPARGPSAWEVVNRTDQEELADIFHRLGEERHSRAIAAEICRRRRQRPIDSPAELAELVKTVAARRDGGRTWRVHPATRVMMALRIYVNRELRELEALLEELPDLVLPGGRAAVLTYHSLEARRVKRAWRSQQGLWETLTDTPWTPTAQQISENPRVRSAQLRAARRL